MTIPLATLASIPSASSSAAAADVASFIEGADPTADARIGAVAELVVKPISILEARLQIWIAQYLQSRSLLDLQTSPDLADDDAVDALLSNFNVTRQPGSTSTGQVQIVVSANLTVGIGTGSTFTIDGLSFVAPISYTAKKEPELIFGPGDVLIQQANDGTYFFAVTLNSADADAAANVAAGAVAVPDVLPSNFVRAYALTDFTGGISEETNADLVGRLAQGVAAPTPSNRTTMQAWLRQTPGFASFVRSSIVGAGQPEMLRSKHSLFPVDAGGRVDWYVRTTPETATAQVTANATLVSVAGDGTGTWQVSVGRDAMPGFYGVESIAPATADAFTGGLEITSETRGFDLSDFAYPTPDIRTAAEALYSRFQTTVFQFSDLTNGASVGATQNYSFSLRGLPSIDALQDLISTRPYSHVGADCLVKASVPCYVDAVLRVEKRAGTADPDFAAMASAAEAYVESVTFSGRLYASGLLAAAAPYLANNSGLVVEALRGTIPQPGGLPIVVADPELLVIPTVYPAGVSLNTVQFFSAGITVYSVVALPASG